MGKSKKLLLAAWITGAVLLCGCAGADKKASAETESQVETVAVTDAGTGAQETQAEETGEPVSAIDFQALDMNGETVSLSDFYGKPVLLNFWASWCGPCRSEMPYLDQAYLDYGDRVNFVMVDLVEDSEEAIAADKAFIEEQGYSFPVCFDTKQEAARAYQVMSIPTTFFIDADGTLTGYHIGAFTEEALLDQMERMVD